MLDLTGKVLAGRFRVDAAIASGGMGAVYVATDTSIGRLVALKMLHPDLAMDADNLERLREEAFSLASVRHPNIVQLYDFHRGGPEATFMVMELIEGESLARGLVRRPRLPVEVAVDYAKQTLSALAAAHAQGIVHRDIKPGNLMVVSLPARRELVKVLDFGIAKLTESTLRRRPTTSSLLLGTPEFMSPEQTGGGAIDARTDIHAVGVVLYRMLAGLNPLAGPDVPTTLQLVNTLVPPDIREHRSDVPEETARAIARALAKSPAMRFSSAEEFAEALGFGQLTAMASRRADAASPAVPYGVRPGAVVGPAADGAARLAAVSQTDETAGARLGGANALAQPAHTHGATASPSSYQTRPPTSKSASLLVGIGVGIGAVLVVGLVGAGAWVAWREMPQPVTAPSDAAPPMTAPLVTSNAAPEAGAAQPSATSSAAPRVTKGTAPAPPATAAVAAAAVGAPSSSAAATKPLARDEGGACQCLPQRGNKFHGDNVALAPRPTPLECRCESSEGTLCPHAISPVPCNGRPNCDNTCRARFISTLGAPCTGWNSEGHISSSVIKDCAYPKSVRTYEGPSGRACRGLTVDGQMVDGTVFCSR